jgi:CRISPR-associated protein Csd1
MILQALSELYERKQADPDPGRRLPAFGFEEKQIPFVVEIDAGGRLVQIRDTREAAGNRRVGRTYLVPQGAKKTSGVVANLLWDTAEYALGVDTRGKPARVAGQHAAFAARLARLPLDALNDIGVRAVLAFLQRVPREALEKQPAWQEICHDNPVVAFQLQGDVELACQRPAVTRNAGPVVEQEPTGTCLITGTTVPVERVHTAIKGVWGSQTSGAKLVSFNLDAFSSFGLEQGANAPVGKSAAFAYTTALNHLLARESGHRLQVGDASTVIWAQRPDELEEALPLLFGETKDDPTVGVEAAKKLYAAVQSGRLAGVEGDNWFYVLGLAPNAARIAVRFWYEGPLRELAPRIIRHFEDLRVDGPKDAPEHLSLFRLLLHCAASGKADNIPPRLGGEILRAVFAGERAPYPRALLNAAVNRCRAERKVPYPRAAAIKGWLNRNIRSTQSSEKEFTPMLDPDNPSTAYRLGRLFAALEKIQEEAQPGINATIRERYYGAASSTPVAVFTTLLRLKNHHLAKLPGGRKTQFERLLGDVLAGIGDFPAHLNLPDQARFALGYYHQRQAFFTKSTDKE